MDMSGDVKTTGEAQWQSGYEALVAARRAQIDTMIAFAESTTCRMAALVTHFGDTSDKAPTCGLCDICNPSTNSASTAHQPTSDERRWLRTILSALESRSTSTGKLFTDLALTKDRKDFDTLLDGLARAALITLTNDTFRTPEGRDITYRKAAITHEGREPDDRTLDTVWLRTTIAAVPVKKSKSTKPTLQKPPLNPHAEQLFEQLRAWRTEQAKPTKTPAFMIVTDAVLRAIATTNPQNLTTLNAIPGMGPSKVDRYGAAILAVCRGEAPLPTPNSKLQPDRPPQPPATPPKTPDPRTATSQPQRTPTKLSSRPEPALFAGAVERPAVQISAVHENKRPTSPPPPPAELTPTQQALDLKLRTWRKQEAAQAGLPSFFIFSDTSLRNIVLAQPQSLTDLRTIRGLDPEKLSRFGPTLLDLCRA